MLKILTVPEATQVLRTKSEPIEKLDAELLAFLKELGKTLKGQKNPAGVGLSAIQVGRPIRVFAMFLPSQGKKEEVKRKKDKSILRFYVNPEMVEHAEGMTLGEELNQRTKDEGRRTKGNQPFLEGCLSIPRIYGEVLRYPWIKAKAMVLTEPSLSQQSTILLDGLSSRVFQHELDHLNGILFTDHVLAEGNQLYREEGRELVEMEM